jgi:carbon monoxide dehydrogenase subunit G
MQLEEAFTLTAEQDAVWRAFHDLPLLVACLPGAAIDAAAPASSDPAEVPLLFKVKLGPIAAGFAGHGRLELDATTRSGRFSGAAVDSRTNSRVKGEARFGLGAADAGGTRVTMTVDYAITGTLAQFSREGIVRALAAQLSRQFADNLQARLPTAAPAPDETYEPASTATLVAAQPIPGAAPALDLWRLFKAWLRGLLPGRRGT